MKHLNHTNDDAISFISKIIDNKSEKADKEILRRRLSKAPGMRHRRNWKL